MDNVDNFKKSAIFNALKGVETVDNSVDNFGSYPHPPNHDFAFSQNYHKVIHRVPVDNSKKLQF